MFPIPWASPSNKEMQLYWDKCREKLHLWGLKTMSLFSLSSCRKCCLLYVYICATLWYVCWHAKEEREREREREREWVCEIGEKAYKLVLKLLQSAKKVRRVFWVCVVCSVEGVLYWGGETIRLLAMAPSTSLLMVVFLSHFEVPRLWF